VSDTVKLSGPMLPPKSGQPAKQLMVLLHGYGADGSDLIGLAGEWRDDYPDMLFVSPNAPRQCGRNPGGFEWFALSDRPVEDFRRAGADLARPVIVNFLIDLWAQTGLSAKDTILCGFSQGAMMVLHVGLSLDQPVCGIVAFSGALIPPTEPWSTPPVALIHGDIDSVVPVQLSFDAEKTLKIAGVDARLFVEEGTAHGIAPDGLGFATGFLHSVMPLKA
jgi:phospholipase/carboxylesterase